MGEKRERKALFVTGTVGIGKTSVAEVIGDLLRDAHVPNAVIDIDALSKAWPVPAGDRFNTTMALRNLRSVSANFFDAGILRLVLAGVLESHSDRDRFQGALDVPMAVCRLQAHLSVVHERLVQRHIGDTESLEWHLHRSGELDDILEAASVEDFSVDNSGTSLVMTATNVMRAAAWD